MSTIAFPTLSTFSSELSPVAHLNELKALLVKNKNTIPEFTLTPCRSVTFSGEAIAYKIRPLLADDKGCLTIRMKEEEVEELIAWAEKDPQVEVAPKPTRLFSRPIINAYKISLCPDTPLGTPLPNPSLKVHPISHTSEPRITPEWMDEEEAMQLGGCGDVASIDLGKLEEMVMDDEDDTLVVTPKDTPEFKACDGEGKGSEDWLKSEGLDKLMKLEDVSEQDTCLV